MFEFLQQLISKICNFRYTYPSKIVSKNKSWVNDFRKSLQKGLGKFPYKNGAFDRRKKVKFLPNVMTLAVLAILPKI